jgi:VanZ family protein
MNSLYNIVQDHHSEYQRIYRIIFYVACITLLATSVMKFGGALNRTKVGIGEFKLRLDHLLHAAAYFIFSLYYTVGEYFGLKLFDNRGHLFFFIFLFGIGLLAEVLQIWVPYRSFNPMDMVANLVGIGVGYLITLWIEKGRRLKAEG